MPHSPEALTETSLIKRKPLLEKLKGFIQKKSLWNLALSILIEQGITDEVFQKNKDIFSRTISLHEHGIIRYQDGSRPQSLYETFLLDLYGVIQADIQIQLTKEKALGILTLSGIQGQFSTVLEEALDQKREITILSSYDSIQQNISLGT